MSDKNMRKHYVRAAYAPDGPGALAMISLLEENGIDAFRQGGIKDIYKIGGDICGEEIMVDPVNLERAQELLGQPVGKNSYVPKPASVRKTLLSLLASAALFVILLLLRGRFLT